MTVPIMPIRLDAGTIPPLGVATPYRLAVFVGDAPRQLLILSGVAISEWRSGGDLDRQEVVIRLGLTTTPRYDWTATVSLAAISNDDTDFLFALDSTSMDTDQDGTLRLHVAIAAQGEPADLLRFSYQVHVLSDPVHSLVSGLISWPRQFDDPTYAVLQGGDPIFRVEFGETVPVPAPGQQFQQTTFVPACAAGLSSKPVAAGDVWVAAYEVDNVPLGRQWEVLTDRTLGRHEPAPAHRWPRVALQLSGLDRSRLGVGKPGQPSPRMWSQDEHDIAPPTVHRRHRRRAPDAPGSIETRATATRRPRAETSEMVGEDRMAIDAALYFRSKCYFKGNRYLRMIQPGARNAGIGRGRPANPLANMDRPSLALACVETCSDHFGAVRARIVARAGGEDGFLVRRNTCRSKPRH